MVKKVIFKRENTCIVAVESEKRKMEFES